MKEQLKIKEKKPVKICGIRQNCYVLDVRTDTNAFKAPTQKKYYSLERKQLDNGYIEEIFEKDYPITPEAVASYADGADYRNDVAQAIENAPKRINLGDISQAQDFINSDPLNACRQYKTILDKVEAYFKAQEKAQKVNQGQGQNQGEVKNNG